VVTERKRKTVNQNAVKREKPGKVPERNVNNF
jgi:hypothetical protein